MNRPADAGSTPTMDSGITPPPVIAGRAGPQAGPKANEAAPARPSSCARTVNVANASALTTAISGAKAGDCIVLAVGRYAGDFSVTASGTKEQPITIMGPESGEAVITGGGGAHVFEVRGSYVTVYGFTIDGLMKSCADCACKVDTNYRDSLLWIWGPLKGARVLRMKVQNAMGECIRVKRDVTESEVGWSEIRNCGRGDFRLADGSWCGLDNTKPYVDGKPVVIAGRESWGKNGEGIYVGTAPEQVGQKGDPSRPDVTADNRFHHNKIDTRGNECLGTKEAATRNVVEYNTCTGQGDPNSAGFDSRGNGNTFEWNDSSGNWGCGFRTGGDDPTKDGQMNVIRYNTIRANRVAPVRVMADKQTICGNVVEVPPGMPASGTYKTYPPDQACSP